MAMVTTDEPFYSHASWRLPAVGLLLLFSIGLLGFLYYKTQMFDRARQNQVFLDLRLLKQMDVEWSANILRSRIGMNNDYDPLSLPVRPMQAMQEYLVRSPELGRMKAATTGLARFGTAFAEKRELVERFKSQNAILRNSLIYFPIAIEELKEHLREVARARPGQALEWVNLEAQTSTLMADTLRFNLAPDAQLASQIHWQLEQLNDRPYPARIHSMLEQLSAHISVILRQRVLEDALLMRLSVIASDRIIDDVIQVFEQEFAQEAEEKQRYRMVLSGYAIFLFLLLGYAVWHFARRYRINLSVVQQLQASNVALVRGAEQRSAGLARQTSQLAEMAAYDDLTGLANRAQLMKQLELALSRAERRASVVVLMHIGLDGLQAVHQAFGHTTGDAVLQEVAQRVPRNLRQEDCFARLSNEEFVILLEDVATREGALRVAQEALYQIEQIALVSGHPVRLSACIGISCARGRSGESHSPAALLNEADQAFRQAMRGARITLGENAKWDEPSPVK